MAKIKLRLSAKKGDSEPYIKEEVTSPTIRIKTPKSSSSLSSMSTSTTSLPKIRLKPLSEPEGLSSLPTIKFKTSDPSKSSSSSSSSGTTISLSKTITLDPSSKTKRTPTIRVKPAKLPGNGYDSEDPDKEDDPLIEEAIVLRFLPDETLDKVRAAVESAERGDKHNNNGTDLSSISVTWSDKRRAIVRVHDIMYAAKLVYLPTISEVHKTIDRKNIFKTVDVSQMLLVVKRIYNEQEIFDLPIDKEYGETYPDGLTPPMEYAKQKFHKKYEANVIQNVEDEVARLLKLDAEAESSVFEFIDADDENMVPISVIEAKIKNKKAKKEKKRLRKERENLQKEKEAMATTEDSNADFEDIDNELDRLMREEEENDGDLDEDDGDDNDDDDDDDEEDEEEDGDEEDIPIEPVKQESESEDDGGDGDDDDDDDDDDDNDEELNGRANAGDEEATEFEQHNALLLEEITELETTISQKEKDLQKAINPIMRNRINDVISRLQQELDMKKQQIVAEEELNKQHETENGADEADDGGEGGDDGAADEDDEDEDMNKNDDNDEEGEGDDNEGAEKNEGDDDAEGNNEGDDDDEDEEDEDDYDDLF